MFEYTSKECKKINMLKNYLHENNINYENNFLGNNYFNDNFSILCFTISIDFIYQSYDIANNKNAMFLKYCKKNLKDFTITRIDNPYNPHFIYRIVRNCDIIALNEHEKRTRYATDQFNNWRHYLIEKYGKENISA